MPVTQHLPTAPEHERPVPLQERGKGVFVPPADELLKQLAVTLLVAVFGLGKVADIPQHDCHLTWHFPPPVGLACLY
jgi:hypothetical protein